MGKRFTDTELYDKDWFVALSPEYKLFWHYITSKCVNAGIWDVNTITACRIIGINEIDLDDFAAKCNSDGKIRILIFPNKRKLFITTTIAFQYKNYLDENIFAHLGVINFLRNDEITEKWFIKEIENGVITYVPKHLNNYTSNNNIGDSCSSSCPNDYPNETPVSGDSLGYKNKHKNKNSINREKEGMGEKEEEIKISSDPAIHVREVLFSAECMVFKDKYGEDMILDFIRYWTEPNKSKSKMRFEREPTWDLSRRLTTWENNNKTNFGRKNGSTNTKSIQANTLGQHGTRTSTL